MTEMNDELRPEYELPKLPKGGVRGKYAERYRAGSNLVLLEPDVAKVFPSEKAVNEALRPRLVSVAKHLKVERALRARLANARRRTAVPRARSTWAIAREAWNRTCFATEARLGRFSRLV
jgi:hypothetical protein